MILRHGVKNIFVTHQKFFIFCVVGLMNTLVHAFFVLVIVKYMSFSSTFSNFIAFMFANIFSYIVNGVITFKSKISLLGYIRFFSVSTSTLIIIISISSICEFFRVDYRISLLLVLILSPIISFALTRRYAFKSPRC